MNDTLHSLSAPPPAAVMITGGAQRVGRAMALAFAQAGYDVALHYHRSETPAALLAGQIEALGRRCVLLHGDLSDARVLEPLVVRAFEALPHLRVLINNASIFPRGTLAEATPEAFAALMAIHVQAPMLLSRAFVAQCPAADIIMMGDTHITGTGQSHFAYLLSKKSLIDLAQMLARALAPRARVNAICPGAVLPELDGDTDYLNKRGATLPLQHTASVDDVVQAALFLARYRGMTGNVLYIDGGEHLL